MFVFFAMITGGMSLITLLGIVIFEIYQSRNIALTRQDLKESLKVHLKKLAVVIFIPIITGVLLSLFYMVFFSSEKQIIYGPQGSLSYLFIVWISGVF